MVIFSDLSARNGEVLCFAFLLLCVFVSAYVRARVCVLRFQRYLN